MNINGILIVERNETKRIKKMKRKAMMKALTEKFGLMLATVEYFHGEDDKAEGGIWVRSTESSYIGENRAFNYYAGECDNKGKLYNDGVHNKIYKFLEKHGWYAEPYDAGTYMLYN